MKFKKKLYNISALTKFICYFIITKIIMIFEILNVKRLCILASGEFLGVLNVKLLRK